MFGLPERGKFGFQGAFESAGDEPVLRLDRVVLAPGPIGLVAGSLDAEFESPQGRGVCFFGIGERQALSPPYSCLARPHTYRGQLPFVPE